MARASGLITCWICGGEEVSQVANYHHKVPRAFGGGDDPSNLVWLHAGHHDLLHRMAEHLVADRAGKAADMSDLEFPNQPKARQKLWELAQLAANSQIAWKDRGLQSLSEGVITVKVALERGFYMQIKAQAHDNGCRSVPKYIAKILDQVIF